jgi:hypothetical protein
LDVGIDRRRIEDASENFLDGVNRPVAVPLPNTNREQAIEERVLRRSSLVARQRAEMVVRVIAHADPRRRGPSKSPPVMGTVRRVP